MGVSPMSSNITRYTYSSGTDVVAVSQANAQRILIRATQDIRIALDEARLDNDYFTLLANQTVILDPPNLTQGYFYYTRLDSASTGNLEVWLMGVVY